MKHRDNYTFLTTAPVRSVVLQMAVPTIVCMLVTSLYNMADTFFVGRLNTQSTAAVGIAFSIMSVVQAIGFFFGHGSGNFISRCLGARRREEAETMAATGFAMSLIGGAIVGAVGLAFLRPLVVALGATPTIEPLACTYLGIVLAGTPLMTASLTLNHQMRLQGNALYGTIGITGGVVLNILLNPLFIFTFDMGIAGAACATVASQGFSLLILLSMTQHRGNISVHPRRAKFSRTLMHEIVCGGSPSLMRQGLAALSMVALNHAAAICGGDAAIASMSIVSRFCFFVFSVVLGLGQGFQPLCGFCYGARLYDRVREGFKFCVVTGTVFLIVCAVVCWALAPDIVRLFRSDDTVVAIGTDALRFQLLTFPLLPLIGLSNMYLQNIRRTVSANLAAMARSGLFFLPLLPLLSTLWGLTGVEACQPLSDLCAFSLCLPLAVSALRKMGRE